MAKKKGLTKDQTRALFEQYPPAVQRDFDRAWGPMSKALSADQLATWAETGATLAGHTVRSWEAAVQYFKASPKVVGLMPFNYFIRWAQSAVGLCDQSPTLAAAYLQASPGTMAVLRSRHIEAWANLGGRLYKGTWKSSTLACRFFETSPELVRTLTMPELDKFVVFLDALSHRSYDLATESITLGQKIFPLVGPDRGAFITLASSLAQNSWRQVKSFFDAASRALPRIESSQRLRFLTLADGLVQRGGTNIPAVMLEVSESLGELDPECHSELLDLTERLIDTSPEAVPAFLRSSSMALQRVSMAQLHKWFEEGVRMLDQNPEGGLAYFRMESTHAEKILEVLSSSVEFGRIKDVMEMYCCALAGADMKLSATDELVDKNIGWVSGESATTEGTTVYVPTVEDRYPSKEENFAWFKVVSTHQVAHLEFGSFDFEYGRPSVLFRDLRPKLNGRAVPKPESPASTNGKEAAGVETAWVTDMQRFFDQFEDRALALDIFTVVEDGRLDARVKNEYQGIRKPYERVQADSVKGRREIQSLPMREAMVEFLVRISLNETKDLPVPEGQVDNALKIWRIAKRVFVPRAEVEDTAEATLRIYAILADVRNEEVPEDEWQELDLEDEEEEEDTEDSDEGLEELLQQMMEGTGTDEGLAEGQGEEGEEQEYESTQDVDFRGDFKPELVQLLAELRKQQQGEQDGESPGAEITPDMVEQALENSAELGSDTMDGNAQSDASTLASSLIKEAGLDMPNAPELGQGPLVHVEEGGRPLDPTEPQTFVYDEWDFRAEDYKPRWCIVRQKHMTEGDVDYYSNTLNGYSTLVSQVRRQFELMVPEMFRKVRKLEDGEDIDIDAVIEAFVDIRTGAGPSEKLYWRRNKVQRDVAVAFLLDTSASTAEAIDEARKVADDWNAPDDPVEYMVWLRSRRGDGTRRSYKRIIDLEKEAIVLLINALEAIGDTYGIYSFSGYGRENVEFYTVKDVDERFSERVKRRIDRIAPLHATRMGPAIRHATSKLEMQDARTKLLFLISDGRPQDRGYSREGVEKEYAVHDTKKALDEAKTKDITAFCLTVDKNGHDYLKTMCDDMGYEVLDDIYMLPQRLLYLYRRLTM